MSKNKGTNYEKLIKAVKRLELKEDTIMDICEILQLRYAIELHKDKDDDTDKIIDVLCDLGIINNHIYPFSEQN